MLRVALFTWRLLTYLPTPLVGLIGYGLGWLMYWPSKTTTLTNLRLCFPDMPPAQRRRLARRHFMALGRSAFELGLHFWQPKSRVLKMVNMKGWENLARFEGRPVIILNPHFIGLNNGSAAMSERLWASMTLYSRQKDPVFDKLLFDARERFGAPQLFARQDGLRPVVKLLKQGVPFFYLPDMNFDSKDAVFVPFFGVLASTLTMPSRLCKMTGAKVVPAVTRQLSVWKGYEMTFYPAWEDFPCGDPAQDARRMNEWIEQRVLEMPEQYYWVHKRFLARPPGAPHLY